MKKETKREMFWIILMILFLFIFFMTGCKTHTVYIPIEHTKTEYRDRHVLDSIFYRDTVQITNRGDTVFKDVVRWRERFVRDTVRYERIDSIPYVVEVEKPVNYLTKWQKIRLSILNIIAGLALAYVAYRLGRRKLF